MYFVLLLITFLCGACGQIEDPFAHIKQLHQTDRESLDRKQDDPPFYPKPPLIGEPPHYFWEEKSIGIGASMGISTSGTEGA